MRKAKMTTVTAQNLINGNEAGFAQVNELLKDRGYNAVDVANMLAAAINNGIITEANKEEYKPARQGFAPDFTMLIKLSLSFLDAMVERRLSYTVKHVSLTYWTHYIDVQDHSSLASFLNLNDFFYMYCGQSRCTRSGDKLHGLIKQSGSGYDKVYDLHQHALHLLRTLNLIENASHFDRMYTAK